MKKFLLSLALAILTIAGVHAEEVVFDFVNNTYDLGENQDRTTNAPFFTEGTATNENVTFSVSKTGGNGFRYWSDGLRVFKTGNGDATFKLEVNGTISSVVLKYAKAFTSVKVDGIGLDKNTTDKTYTWTGSKENEISIVMTQTSGNYSIASLTITYEPAAVDPDAVAKPTIEFDKVSNTVTLSCATEGAAIYYTLDGFEPTDASTAYTGPFTVAESCTVKAVAYNNGKASAVASKDVVVLKTVNSLAELFAATPANGDKAIVGCELTVVYVDDLNVFVVDAEGTATLLYGSNSYNAGDVVPAGWEAEYELFSGTPEYKGTFPAATGTAELTFANVQSVTADDVNRVVVITDVTFADVTPSELKQNFNGTLSDGTTLQFRTKFNGVQPVDAGTYNVKVAVGVYNKQVQVYPIEYTPVQGVVEKVAEPVFSPAGGTITEATEVTITCATEGASIYYTLDGTTPDENATLYEGAITVTETTTIMAIAMAADMEPSEVAVAEFVYSTGGDIEVVAGTVTYDFTSEEDIASLGITSPEGESTGTDVSDMPLVKTPITVTVGGAGNAPKLWRNKGTHLRCYKSNILTVKADDNTDIKSIKFEGERVTSKYIDGLTDGTWTAGNDAISTEVSFNILDSARINTITVDYETTTGVEAVAADNSDAPVEYYNLQGVRVAEPANGLYIRRQGNTVTKVLVK